MNQSKGGLSRRGFAATLAAAPVLLAQEQAPAANEERDGTVPDTPPFQGALIFEA